MPASASEVGVDFCLPGTLVGAIIADVAHEAAFCTVHHADSFAVVHVVGGAAFVDAKIPCGFDGVDVCPEEDEFPAVFFFLALDHFSDPFGGVFVAGVFVAVGGDDEEGLFRAIFFAGVLVDVSDVVDSSTDGVKEGGAAAGIVFLIGQGFDARERDAVVDLISCTQK